MARKIPLGRYAHGQMAAIRMAEALQLLAIAAIKEDFSAENEKELSLERITYTDYMEQLQSAINNDTLEDFNERLRKLMTPVIEQVMAAAQQVNEQGGQA